MRYELNIRLDYLSKKGNDGIKERMLTVMVLSYI